MGKFAGFEQVFVFEGLLAKFENRDVRLDTALLTRIAGLRLEQILVYTPANGTSMDSLEI